MFRDSVQTAGIFPAPPELCEALCLLFSCAHHPTGNITFIRNGTTLPELPWLLLCSQVLWLLCSELGLTWRWSSCSFLGVPPGLVDALSLDSSQGCRSFWVQAWGGGKLEAPNTWCLGPKALKGQLHQQRQSLIPAALSALKSILPYVGERFALNPVAENSLLYNVQRDISCKTGTTNAWFPWTLPLFATTFWRLLSVGGFLIST